MHVPPPPASVMNARRTEMAVSAIAAITALGGVAVLAVLELVLDALVK